MSHRSPAGFIFISVIIALAMIIAMAVWYLRPDGNKQAVTETGRKAEDQLDVSKQKMQNYQSELQQNLNLQNDLNSFER